MSFMKKSKRNLFLLGALALVLVITGGIFAGAWFSASGSDSPTWKADFASVSANTTNIEGLLPSNIHGGTWFDVTTKDPMFTIDPDDNYTGDLWVTVYIANTDNLSTKLEHLNIEVACDNSTAPTQVLTLDNGKVAFPVSTYPSAGFDVSTTGGSGYAYSDITVGEAELDLYCEVKPRGLSS